MTSRPYRQSLLITRPNPGAGSVHFEPACYCFLNHNTKLSRKNLFIVNVCEKDINMSVWNGFFL